MQLPDRRRRMISTYPFKYTFTGPTAYFAPENAALYVHIPYCLKKCHYCTYVSVVGSSDDERQVYVKSLCEEIRRFPEIPCYPSYNVDALYLGGGTPSILSPAQITTILDICRKNFDFVPGFELCMELDPSTVTEDKLKSAKDAGFTRISFGVQSFDDSVLHACNRSHSSATAYTAIELAQKLGMTNFNIDLMFPLPGITFAGWEHTLREAIRLDPAAITAHVLEVWPRTRFAQTIADEGYVLPSFEEEIAMTNLAYDVLESSGFKRWSTCGYYHPERTTEYCRFMDYYWKSLPMMGFGVSAKTLLGSRAYTNVSSLATYMARICQGQSALDFSVLMTKRQEMLRVMIRGLKVCAISKAYFVQRFGVSMELVFEEQLQYLVQKGWLLNLPDRIELTRSGQVHDRSVYSAFYTEDDLRPAKDGEVMFGLSQDVDNPATVVAGEPGGC